MEYQPKLPPLLKNLSTIGVVASSDVFEKPVISECFPNIAGQKILHFEANREKKSLPLKMGVLFSGGQAPGGHNVIAGLFDAMKELNSESTLLGFLGGPQGIIDNAYIKITASLLTNYRNQGGFDLIGSGRTKIESTEQYQTALKTVKQLDLDGLVIIGGDDSNTNAAFLAEYFLNNGCKTKVVGVPKTIDGDLKNEHIEISFGFDTACKVYSELIGNICRDVLSSKKYYFFIKLMGRSASHVTLECAMQTHPNLTLIGEEIEAQNKTLQQLVEEITDLICERASQGKDYGVILIPEGVIEFIPECKQLISELNVLMGKEVDLSSVSEHLSESSLHCFNALSEHIRKQLLIDRDPHGNVKVSKIETERFFIEMVKEQLRKRKSAGIYKGAFSAKPLFYGYEGRSGFPSTFDCDYCYSLGYVSALVLNNGATGYMACIQHLDRPAADWRPAAIPLLSMMDLEMRLGKSKPVIKKALVDLKGEPFLTFQQLREDWTLVDGYVYPGPIQYGSN